MSSVLNANKLIDKLKAIADDEVLQPALKYVGVYVEGKAKDNCPANTSQLRQSITSYVKDDTAIVGTNMEYAPYVEIGTGLWAGTSAYSPEYAGTGRQTPWHYQDDDGNWHTTIGQHPQPFLKKAVDDNKSEIEKIFKEKLIEELKKQCSV